MITHIEIRDFAIVEALALAMAPGMTVLTGETGAGKSILVDAVGLALGEKAEQAAVRPQAKRAEIAVAFDLGDNAAARDWLEGHELDADGECILRRTISREGGSKAYVNGRVTPLSQLRELGELLVDIHGQHQHQSLLRRDYQRQLLDEYGGHGGMLQELAEAYRQWRATRQQLDQLRQQGRERDSRLDFLRYQVEELEALETRPGEWQAIEQEHRRLANMDKLTSAAQQATEALEADGSALAGLHFASRELGACSDQEPRLRAAQELLAGAAIQVEEGLAELRQFLSNLEADPERFAELEARMGQLHDVARKHRVEPEALPDLLEQFRGELAALDDADYRLERLQGQLAELDAQYRSLARRLSKARQAAAGRLGQAVSAAMDELGMAGGRFEAALEPLDDGAYSPSGVERVAFHVSANPGQPLQPLAKVASGGELSRISLAIQVITSQLAGVPTLIFDEVDVGIGGGIAEIVGEKLRLLGERRQVLCVTHLPQVAAQGHHHFQVSKTRSGGHTTTAVQPLKPSERVEEIARMLGGVQITDKTRAHAREMLQRAAGKTREHAAAHS